MSFFVLWWCSSINLNIKVVPLKHCDISPGIALKRQFKRKCKNLKIFQATCFRLGTAPPTPPVHDRLDLSLILVPFNKYIQ